MIAGEGFHPGLVVGGALAQDLLVERRDANDLTEEEPLAKLGTELILWIFAVFD